MSFNTLQFFAAELLSKIADEIGENGEVTLVEPISAIVPTDGNRRVEMARFRGSLQDLKAAQSREYKAYAIPAGTVLTPGAGVNDTTVAGNAAFMEVPEAVLVKANELGTGSSSQIREAFAAWVGSQS